MSDETERPVVHIALRSDDDRALCGETILTGWHRDRPVPAGPIPICETCRTRYLEAKRTDA